MDAYADTRLILVKHVQAERRAEAAANGLAVDAGGGQRPRDAREAAPSQPATADRRATALVP